MRIYWAGGCPAFQPGRSRSGTRAGLAGQSVLRVPATTLLHFSECLLLLGPATLPWRQATGAPGAPGAPACEVILAIFLALSGLLYSPWEDVTFLSKDSSTPPQYHGFHGSRWGSDLPFCESQQLPLFEAFVSQFPSGSNILRCQGLRQQGARHPHPLAGGRSWTRAGSGPNHRPSTRVGSGGAGLLH